MQLKALSYPNVEQACIWRNDSMSMNRTPYLLTQEQQEIFYRSIVCDRQANARYWGIWTDLKGFKLKYEHDPYEPVNYPIVEEQKEDKFIGMGEISNIQWENRLGEIGLIMNPGYAYMAEQAIELILEQVFDYLNLENVYGECYECSPYLSIWEETCGKYNARCCYLPNRKYWGGKYYNSLYFNINREEWKKCR
ncbi:MAG: GNAT family protein [Candidatus Babeliales bacterium]|jgi:RimJ/RimL family protein N-acetyltransferase